MSTTEREYDWPARELELHIMNDYEVYRAYYLPACQNLARKWRKGIFDFDLGCKMMGHVATSAAKDYRNQYGSMSDAWFRIFPKGDRDKVAEALCREFVEEMKLDPERTWAS